MKVIALISGGKDSCYNMMQCVREGHQIVGLANLKPKDKDELDSYMYQTVGHHAIDLYAQAMDLPLYRRTIEGSSLQLGKNYDVTQMDEVEDLYELLRQIQNELAFDAVSVGAILSDYQRVRVEHVCQRLGLTCLAYLWRRDQEELLQEMINCGVNAILIKVAALGLEPQKHLGKTLAEIYPHMVSMQSKYGLNVCGEGGEYETFTLDCPLFKKKLVVHKSETVTHSDDAFAPVAYLNLTQMHLEDKHQPSTDLTKLMSSLPMKHGGQLSQELSENLPGELNVVHQTPPDSPSAPCHVSPTTRPIREYVHVTSNSYGYVSISSIMGTKFKDNDIESGTRQAMDILKDVLSQQGLKTSDVIAIHLYVSNMKDFSRINVIYKQNFGINPPIRVCVGAPLPENILLLADCVALKDQEGLGSCISTMHVQSISHWASANIGPYSQAKATGHKIYIAGQIALSPAAMTIIEGGLIPETRLSLRHVSRVMSAMAPGQKLQEIVLAVCYVTKREHIETVQKQFQLVQEYETTDSPVQSILTEYVVVPKLPRDALVEWQMYCTKDWDSSWIHWQSSVTTDIHRANIKMSLSSNEEQHIVTFTIQIEALSRVSENQEVAILQLIATCLQKILQRAECDINVLNLLRVFYSPLDLQYDKLQRAYGDISSDQLVGHLPAVAFVPVMAFESPDVILSVCH